MTAQRRRRRSSLLLLSLVSGSVPVAAVGASTESAHNVPENNEATVANKYQASGTQTIINRSLRGAQPNEDTVTALEKDAEERIPIIDLAAPLHDEAVIPSPLEEDAGGAGAAKSNRAYAYTHSSAAESPPAERALKKNRNEEDEEEDEEDEDDDEDSNNTILGTGNTVYISGGTVDLTNAPITIPPSTPAQCFESKPFMGCDRGGGADQRLKFFNHDFGLGCAQADPCLFALMPIRMAYYCPKEGRPQCGGMCYSVAQHCPASGILLDRNMTGHNITDPKWDNANAAAWNFWPANFGCPSCIS